MHSIDPKKAAIYAGEDAVPALQLKAIQWKRLEKENLLKLYYTLEEPLMKKVLAQIEYVGVTINTQALNEFVIKLNKKLLR
ncbi:MAG: hypothetical protein RBR35_17735 [Salinivirgaceae bacterium]|nr:hypothetical protein [Salinivirgaceae bacterium]